MRESGILMPIFSLASPFGIGCISKEAHDFIDFLKEAGQGYWQLLPIGHTGFGDSPYQPVSSYAGNPYFISPTALIEEGLLTWDECNSLNFGQDQEQVDYGALYENRFVLLEKAFTKFKEKEGDKGKDYIDFTEKQSFWLEDYALYMALKKAHEGKGWSGWEEPFKLRDTKALSDFKKEHKDELEFYYFQQFKFYEQWKELHSYAKAQGIKLIGDLPFYVAMDSVDAWAHPEAFLMDDKKEPTAVAGCPPDDFSPLGQRWGNPLYDWEALKKDNYGWWINRIKHNYQFFDVVRFDHFHGFTEYYSIPFEEETAKCGELKKGPGVDFFRVLEEELKKLSIVDTTKLHFIAEDLGFVTKENTALLQETGIPGMQVLQYAFTGWDSIYLPFKHKENSICYTGTHDNTTARAWFEDIEEGQRGYVRRYINSMNTDAGGFVWDFIREAYRSPSMLCIIPLQDYLVKGREARINCPGTQGENWKWRLMPDFLSGDLARSIRGLAETYSRIPKGGD